MSNRNLRFTCRDDVTPALQRTMGAVADALRTTARHFADDASAMRKNVILAAWFDSREKEDPRR